jgi:DNA-binding transcriptional LysR family regulator
MNLSRLTHFVAVAETGGFTAAAVRLGLGQSAVSTSVRRLEEELGAPLFVRAPHKAVELTDAGQALLPEARALIAAAGNLREVVRTAGHVMHGSVRFGGLEQTRGLDVVDAMTAFRASHPGVRLQYHRAITGPAELIELVRVGRLDFALSATIRDPPFGVAFRTLGSAPYAVLAARGHALAAVDGPLRAEHLRDEPFVGSLTGTPERADLDYLLRLLGVRPPIAFEVNGIGDTLELVRRGAGVALLPTFVARGSAPAVRALAVDASLPRCRGIVVTRAEEPLSGPAAAFLEAVLGASGADPGPAAIGAVDARIDRTDSIDFAQGRP